MRKSANTVVMASLETEIMKWEWIVWEEGGWEN